MKKIISVVGARPNFMKVAPIHFEFAKHKDIVNHLICHTGQHYDQNMSNVFFEELELPKPDFHLGVGSGSHAQQTAAIMVEFEKVLNREMPDLIIVVGDVNSTIACSLVARKMKIPVAHVEAGLRSFDRDMPEEINRILTDAISDYLFVSEPSGMENLKREGISDDRKYLVGNVMIDSLIRNLPKIENSSILKRFNITREQYILATLHRPINVDNKTSLTEILEILNKHAQNHKIIFPVHPRTKANFKNFDLEKIISQNLIVCDPIGYIDFISLIKNAALIITDSGGIQEESTFLKVQCLTLRENTERPITIELGTNHLIGTNIENIDRAISSVLNSQQIKEGTIPPLWDGKAAERICNKLIENI